MPSAWIARPLVAAPELPIPPAAARLSPSGSAPRGREPVAYILGRKGFRRIELAVDVRVLIPRPETELLVEVALALPQGARVHDVGTGIGRDRAGAARRAAGPAR